MRRLGELAHAAGSLFLGLTGAEDTPVEDLSNISDKVSPGDLFFCIKGFGVDGHDFAAQAVESGAVALCVERPIGAGVPEVVVRDSRAAAPVIAAQFFDHPADDLTLIGVTGTNGKTTTTYLLESILEADGRSTGLIGTIGARIVGQMRSTVCTTPDPIDLQRLLAEMRSKRIEAVALEVTSHGLALHRVDGLHFDSAVFTNLSREHLGFHGGMDEYFAVKRSLFEPGRSAQAAVNLDDAYGRDLSAATRVPWEGFGRSPDAAVRAENLSLGRAGSTFTLVTPIGELAVSTGLAGAFNVSNCLAAATAAIQVGVELEAVREGIARVVKVPGRFEFVEAGQPFSVVIDYAHTPAALESVLGEGRRLIADEGGRLLALFGCGGGTDPGKRPLMGEIAATLSDHLVLTSDNPREEEPWAIIEQIASGTVVEQARCSPTLFEERGQAIDAAVHAARAGDMIVIAGKGHETSQQLADRTVHFDDRQVALAALGSLGWNGKS